MFTTDIRFRKAIDLYYFARNIDNARVYVPSHNLLYYRAGNDQPSSQTSLSDSQLLRCVGMYNDKVYILLTINAPNTELSSYIVFFFDFL